MIHTKFPSFHYSVHPCRNRLTDSYLIRVSLFCLLLFCASLQISAQRVSIKTNTLDWLVAAPNLGVEFAIGDHWSFEFSATGSPWRVTDDLYLKHYRIQPELRYWLYQNLSGLYIGAAAYYTAFDMGLKKRAYYGDAVAGGLTCGYNWILSRRWNLEISAGVGAAYCRYQRYMPGEGHGEPDHSKVLPAPVKLAVSFIYVVK